MFSIKVMGTMIFPVIFFPKFLAWACMKKYGKKTMKISLDPLNMMLNIGLIVPFCWQSVYVFKYHTTSAIKTWSVLHRAISIEHILLQIFWPSAAWEIMISKNEWLFLRTFSRSSNIFNKPTLCTVCYVWKYSITLSCALFTTSEFK